MGGVNIQMDADLLTVHWFGVSRAQHDDYVNRLKSITGATFDKTNRRWTVPARQADRLYAAFPEAAYDYDAICAVVAAERRHTQIFAENLIALGVKLEVDAGQIVAVGDGVSPLLQRLVNERSVALLEWLQSQPETPPSSSPHKPAPPEHASPDELHRAGLLAAGMRNAARARERKSAIIRRRFAGDDEL